MMDHYYQDIQGWLSDTTMELYREGVRNASATEPSAFLEIGAWKGRSTAFLGVEIINSLKPITLTVVDTFTGSDERPHQNDPDIGRLRDVFEESTYPLKAAGLDLRVLEGESQRVLRRLAYASAAFDFIYVDGSHKTYDVSVDINYSKMILKPGGLLAGDDYDFPEVWRGVQNSIPGPDIARHGTSWVYNVGHIRRSIDLADEVYVHRMIERGEYTR